MFHHTQGVADIAIKLFAIAQARAIYDGTETITGTLIESVALNELALVIPMIEAIRRDDVEALVNYRDIAPTGLDKLLAGVGTKFSGRKVRGASINGANPLFVPTVVDALTSVGFDLPEAQELASQVADCVFQAKLDTESTPNWTASPEQTGHPVHGKLDTRSTANWTPSPGQTGHP